MIYPLKRTSEGPRHNNDISDGIVPFDNVRNIRHYLRRDTTIAKHYRHIV